MSDKRRIVFEPPDSNDDVAAEMLSTIAGYSERIERFEALAHRARRQSAIISILRISAVALGLVCFGIYTFSGRFHQNWIVVLGVLFAISFFVLVIIHDRVIRAIDRFDALCQINREACWRINREWTKLSPAVLPTIDEAVRGLSSDLDLLAGQASLFQLIGSPNTPSGRRFLAQWLCYPADPDEIRARQTAVKELIPALDFRQELTLLGRATREQSADAEPLAIWAVSPPWLGGRRWLLWTIRLCTVVSLFSIVGYWLGFLVAGWPLVALLVNGGISTVFARKVHSVFDRVYQRSTQFGSYADLLRCVSEGGFCSPMLKSLRKEIAGEGMGAYKQMKQLERWVELSDLRHNFLFYAPIQAVCMWDFHVLWLLERWQTRTGVSVRRWLEAIGRMEALSGLASVAHQHLQWTFPTVCESAVPGLSAKALGHPLLRPDICVGNDVALGEDRRLLFVTGSNMSGKSTFLRAIGLNAVLAQAGGPVCARYMTISPLVVGSSFRVFDSLQQGVSLFLAELARLKQIVSMADRNRTGGRGLIFFLDEVLHGTNVRERRIAVRGVLERLLEAGAIGAISSHDLSLTKTKSLAANSNPIHFRETYVNDTERIRMRFDYKVRPGVATDVNALKLLETIGISIRHREPGDSAIGAVSDHETA